MLNFKKIVTGTKGTVENRRNNQGYDEFVDFVQRMITVL